MKERPIIFSAPMVRAILEGRKTQTRRVVKPVSDDDGFVLLDYGKGPWPYRSSDGETPMHVVKRSGKLYLDETPHTCPYGQPGDRLWVRETFKAVASGEIKNGYGEVRYGFAYKADAVTRWIEKPTIIHDLTGQPPTGAMQFRHVPWKRSTHMPRLASRILLEVVSVRVEKLKEISPSDALSEGVFCPEFGYAQNGERAPVYLFAGLWESINGPGSWDANPWVWVVEFQRVQP